MVGPWIADGVIVQQLTDYIWVGLDSVLSESHITHIARAFYALKASLKKLNSYYCTISFNSHVTCHTQFLLTPAIIYSQFMAILEICQRNQKVTCCANWMKWWSMRVCTWWALFPLIRATSLQSLLTVLTAVHLLSSNMSRAVSRIHPSTLSPRTLQTGHGWWWELIGRWERIPSHW